MEFAVSLPTKANSWEVARRAEELGFTHAWFFDTALLNAELFAAMAAAAMKTSRIKLCTGVLVPSNRIAPVAASGLATLNALAPGRIVFGVSTGFTARRTLGLGAISLATLETYVRAVEGLLRGETIEWAEKKGDPHKVRFLNPELGLINLKDPIPTFISAFGPKARRLTAQLGAGWIGGGGGDPARELADMRASWAEAGRDPADLYTAVVAAGCVLDEGEPADSPSARAQAGPFISTAFHALVEQEAGPELAYFPFKAQLEAYRKVYERYEPADARYLSNHRGHMMIVRPEETHVDADVIRGMTLTGTRDELVERIRGIKALGFNQIQLHTAPGHENDMLERWADVIERV